MSKAPFWKRMGEWVEALPWQRMQAIDAIVQRALSSFLFTGLGVFVALYLVAALGSGKPLNHTDIVNLVVVAALAALLWTIAKMEWLGFRFQPRLWLWNVATIGLWLAALAALLALEGKNLGRLAFLGLFLLKDIVEDPGQVRLLLRDLVSDHLNTSSLRFLQGWLGLWALAALLGLAAITNAPIAWRKFHTTVALLFCVVAIAGYPAAWFLYKSIGLVLLPSWWVALLLFLLPPILLPTLGVITLGLLALVFGLFLGLLFIILDWPLMVFDYLRARNQPPGAPTEKAGARRICLPLPPVAQKPAHAGGS
jgi:hypothetical protein